MIFKVNNRATFTVCLLAAIARFCAFPSPTAAHDGLHEQIIAVTKQIKKDPKNAALYLKRGELFRLHEEWKNAELDFNRAEKLNPDLAVVDLERGKLWFDTKQFSRAKNALEKNLSKNPDNFEAVITIARVSAKLKQTQTAVKYFTQAIRLAPKDSAEIYLERAETLADAGGVDDALRGLDDGIEKFGGLVTLQSAAIDLESKRKNYDAARARLDKLAAAMPRKESFLLRRGEILLLAGRKCEARKSLLQAEADFNLLSSFQKNVRAVKEQIARLQKLLIEIPAKNCE